MKWLAHQIPYLLLILTTSTLQISAQDCPNSNWYKITRNPSNSYSCTQKSFWPIRKLQVNDSLCAFYNAQINYQLSAGRLDTTLLFIDSLMTAGTNLYHQQVAFDAYGQYFYFRGQLDSSHHFFNKALEKAHERKDSTDIMNVSSNISTIYAQQGKTHKELGILLDILKYKKRKFVEDPIKIVGTYINLGQCYVALRSGEDALTELKKAIRILETNAQPRYYCYAANAMGDAYFILKEYKKSRDWFNSANQLAVELGYLHIEAATDKNLGDIFLQLNQADSAIIYLEKSLKLWHQMGDPFQILHTEISYAGALTLAGQPEKAIELLEVKRTYLDSSAFDILKDSYFDFLSNAHRAVGNLKLALDLMDEYLVIKDSLNASADRMNMAAMRVKHKSWEAEQKNQTLVIKAQRNKVLYWAVLTILIVTLSLLIILSVQRKRNHRTIIENKNKVMSVIAHDLKGPIGSMAELLDIIDENSMNQRTLNMLRKSARSTYALLDGLLHWAKGNQLGTSVKKQEHSLYEPVAETLSFFSTNIDAKNIHIDNQIDPAYQILSIVSLSTTILRNIINNAIKFTPDHGTITISAQRLGRYDQISINDTGIGMSKDLIEKVYNDEKVFSTQGTNRELGSGLGLRVCKDFTETQNGALIIESELNLGTTFKICLPVK